jgi:DNA replication and repair protein RecF
MNGVDGCLGRSSESVKAAFEAVWIRDLNIRGFRCLEDVRLQAVPGLNVLIGGNGAGKSSVLEAISVLASGRSFRTGRLQQAQRHGAHELEIFAALSDAGAEHRVGYRRSEGSWQARIDAQNERKLSNLVRLCPALVFEPHSTDLLNGPAEDRRRLFDWAVFHVEQNFSEHWSQYQRALKQRNSLLRSGTASDQELSVWEVAMSRHAGPIRAARESLLERLTLKLDVIAEGVAARLGQVKMSYRHGYEGELASALAAHRASDRAQRFTALGPHRADWRLRFSEAGHRHELSRGQLKTAAFVVVLALAETFSGASGRLPILALDDLCSELDVEHQLRCLRWLEACGNQVWVTGTQWNNALQAWSGARQLFHVEQGSIEARVA